MKTVDMHPLVKGISPSHWARLCDDRRRYENGRAIREYNHRAELELREQEEAVDVDELRIKEGL